MHAIPAGYSMEPLRAEHAAELAAAHLRNREHLAPWDPVRVPAFFTEAGQAEVLAGQLAAVREGRNDAHVLLHDGRVVGRFNINNIVRGVLQSASVGYWVDRDHLRRGLAVAGVAHLVARARAIDLHRLEAGTMVANTASQAVLLRCGFVEYGLAPQFLHIAGAWQDHRLFQLILDDAPPAT